MQFFEAVIMIAFQRANPKWGEVGSNNKAFSIRADGSVREEKQTETYILLPGCLETLLKDVLLKKAKTDTLAKVKKVIEVDPECQRVFKEHRAYFKEAFKKRSVDGNEAGKEETWTLEVMMEDFLDRQLLKDVIIHPTPAVSGTTPPDVHSNLSWLDAKGAFATCQNREFEKMSKSTKASSVRAARPTPTFDSPSRPSPTRRRLPLPPSLPPRVPLPLPRASPRPSPSPQP